MSMEKEWKELKVWVAEYKIPGCSNFNAYAAIEGKMTELEKRSLPERVAELLENFSHTKLIESGAIRVGQDIVHFTNKVVAKALRTGDTSELEKWQK